MELLARQIGDAIREVHRRRSVEGYSPEVCLMVHDVKVAVRWMEICGSQQVPTWQ